MTATTTILTDSTGASQSAAAIPRFVGVRVRKICLVNFNISSYTSGGEVLPTAASLNMQEIVAVFPVLVGTSTTTLRPVFSWDSTNGKLIAGNNVTLGTETVATSNLGPVYLLIVGY